MKLVWVVAFGLLVTSCNEEVAFDEGTFEEEKLASEGEIINAAPSGDATAKKVEPQSSGPDEDKEALPGVSVSVNGSNRTLLFNPKVAELRPEINVHTILDNSNSMSPIQEKVARAFDKVTLSLKDFNGNMYLHSTTNTNGKDKNSYKVVEYAVYKDDKGVLHKVELDDVSKIPAPYAYERVKDYVISDSYTLNRKPLTFNTKMTDSQFFDFTSNYTMAIDDFGTSGSPEEQGLCTLLRSIHKKEGNSFPVFLIATNENDASNAEDCIGKKVSEVKRKPVTYDNAEECKPGEDGCMLTYKVDHKSYTNESINYDFQRATQSISYTKKKRAVNYSAIFKWDQRRTETRYKIKGKSQKLTYRKMYMDDNILYEDTNVSTKKYPNSWGICSGEAKRSCTDAEIQSLGLEHGIVAGTCEYTCQDYVSSTQSRNTSWEEGVCAGDSETPVACSASQINAIKGSLNSSDITSCTVSCRDLSRSYAHWLPNKPTQCSDKNVNGTYDAKCSDAELSFLVGRIGILSANDQIHTCSTKCTESAISGRKYLPEAADCIGVQRGVSGDVQRACTESESNIAFAHGGSDEIETCVYRCSQTTGSKMALINTVASCNALSRSCNGAEKDFAAAHLRKSESHLNTCTYNCQENEAKPACVITSDKADLCSTSFALLKKECGALNPGHEIQQSSCKITAAVRKTDILGYKDEIQEEVTKPAFEEEASSAVEKALKDAYGDKFFVAAYIYPSDDPMCDPNTTDGLAGDKNLFVGKAYEDLAMGLGEKNAKVFPLCADDYSSSLLPIFETVTEEVTRTYKIDKKTSEKVVRVSTKEGPGVEAVVLKADDYKVEGGFITFKSSKILENVSEVIVDLESN